MELDFKELNEVDPDGAVLNKENVLKKVSQYQIMSYYLGFDIYPILGKSIHSPLRRDLKPSFLIYYNPGDRIHWIDKSTGWKGSAFDMVMRLHGCDFYEALVRINEDFELGLSYEGQWKNTKETYKHGYRVNQKVILPKLKSNIQVRTREFNRDDYDFWAPLGVTRKVLKYFKIFPLQKVFLNGEVVANYHKGNPIYGYLFYKDKKYTWKIYWPYEERGRKWLSNTDGSVLQGWDQLPRKGDLLIITKSLKDVTVLRTFRYYAVATQGEAQVVKKSVAEELDLRFARIVVLNDFELAGVVGANKMRKLYGWQPVFLQNFKTRHNGFKDVADFRRAHSFEETKQKLEELL